METLLRSLSMLLATGLSPLESFELLAREHPRNSDLRVAISRLARGAGLSEALRGTCPPEVLTALEAGERHGRAAEAAGWCADYLESEEERRRQLLSVLAIHPVVFAVLLLICYAAWARLPLEGLWLKLPLHTQLLLEFTDSFTLPETWGWAALMTLFLRRSCLPVLERLPNFGSKRLTEGRRLLLMARCGLELDPATCTPVLSRMVAWGRREGSLVPMLRSLEGGLTCTLYRRTACWRIRVFWAASAAGGALLAVGCEALWLPFYQFGGWLG